MSRTIRGLIFGCMGCAGMALSMGWADTPVKKLPSTSPSSPDPVQKMVPRTVTTYEREPVASDSPSSPPVFRLVPRQKVVYQPEQVTPSVPSDPLAIPAVPRDDQRGTARIEFESNWKNVQVGSTPMYFRQGDKPFIWTVKNTGDTPVDVGDDYGFSITPGAEEFIVDVRLVLSVADDKSSSVEVKASRVMTQSELTEPPAPSPASKSDAPKDQFFGFETPETPSGRRKAGSSVSGREL